MALRLLAASIVLATIGAAAAVLAAAQTPPEPASTTHADPVKVRAAERLPRSVLRIAAGATSPALTARPLRRWVSVRSRAVPLPAGGNFNGIRWEADPRPISVATADAVLQLNARCQWVRARRDGREAATAAAVLRLSARWPAVAEYRATGPFDLQAPGDDPTPCDATAGRERAYARTLGLAPTT